MEAIERDVTLPVDIEEAWRLVSDPDELAKWLGSEVAVDPTPGSVGVVVDPDGTRRELLIDTVEAGRSISWYWWSDDEADDAVVSRVEVLIAPDRDGSRVRVVEQPLRVVPTARATASITSRQGAWSYRLFALEVRCLAVSTAVLARA